MIEHVLLRFDLSLCDRGVLYLIFETSRGVAESQTTACRSSLKQPIRVQQCESTSGLRENLGIKASATAMRVLLSGTNNEQVPDRFSGQAEGRTSRVGV